MRRGLALAAVLLALPAAAESPLPPPDVPLTAEAFDALTRGQTMDTFDTQFGLYGVETFLSGRRVVWKDANRCTTGTWAQVGDQICFTYADEPANPVCWAYFNRGTHIEGWFEGDSTTVPIELHPSDGPPVSCGEYLGA